MGDKGNLKEAHKYVLGFKAEVENHLNELYDVVRDDQNSSLKANELSFTREFIAFVIQLDQLIDTNRSLVNDNPDNVGSFFDGNHDIQRLIQEGNWVEAKESIKSLRELDTMLQLLLSDARERITSSLSRGELSPALEQVNGIRIEVKAHSENIDSVYQTGEYEFTLAVLEFLDQLDSKVLDQYTKNISAATKLNELV